MLHHPFPSMTFTALSARSDETLTDDLVADIIGGSDYRSVTVFLEHEQSCDMRGDYGPEYALEGKRIIGVALCDLDDPLADVTIWGRDTAWTEFGRAWIERMEAVE